ncbi:protease [Escherichia coli]|nr:protease [Escherichia coli]
MRAKLLGIFLTTPIAISSFASTETLSFTPDNINADISLGTLSGKTKERVYLAEEGGRKVSQLDWKFNNAAIIKGAINWDLMPQISIGAAGWTTLGSRSGNMVDQDWMDSSNPGTWTDESRHPDTQLNYANEFNLNIKGWLLNEPNYRLGLMAGYQEMPYIGLTGSYRYEDFELGGTFKYSGWVESSDNDEHYDPGKRITYRSKVKDQNYYSVAVNAGYYVTPNAKVYVEGAWNRVTNKKGNTSLYDHNNNTSDYSKNGAGIENYNFITTAGLKYTF